MRDIQLGSKELTYAHPLAGFESRRYCSPALPCSPFASRFAGQTCGRIGLSGFLSAVILPQVSKLNSTAARRCPARLSQVGSPDKPAGGSACQGFPVRSSSRRFRIPTAPQPGWPAHLPQTGSPARIGLTGFRCAHPPAGFEPRRYRSPALPCPTSANRFPREARHVRVSLPSTDRTCRRFGGHHTRC